MGCGVPRLSLALSSIGVRLCLDGHYGLGSAALGLCCAVLAVAFRIWRGPSGTSRDQRVVVPAHGNSPFHCPGTCRRWWVRVVDHVGGHGVGDRGLGSQAVVVKLIHPSR
jgi:hypothetical protein